MPVDLKRLIDSTMMKGVTVWKEYEGIPGFEVEIAYVSKQHMIQIVETCTKHVYNKEERRFEDQLDREKVARHWAEKIILSWRGLTLEKFQRLFPIEVKPSEKDLEVEPTLENRITLIWNSTDFENWCLAVATSPDYFVDVQKEKEKEAKQLEKQ